MQPPHMIVSLLQGFYWFDSGLQSYLRARGWPTLTHSQSMVMINVVMGATRPVEIARNLGISRQAVHVTLAQIAQVGILRLQDDPTDRRTKIAVLTELGEPMRRHAQMAVNEMTRRLAERIGQPGLAGLIAACGADWGEPIDFERETLEAETRATA